METEEEHREEEEKEPEGAEQAQVETGDVVAPDIPSPSSPVYPRAASLAERLGTSIRSAGAAAGSGTRGLLARVGEAISPPPGPELPEDDVGDLFEGPDPYDNDVYVKDLVKVDEEDVLGVGGEEGLADLVEVGPDDLEANEEDLRDVLEVDESELLGTEEGEQVRARPAAQPGYRPRGPAPPTTGLSGLQQWDTR